MELAGLIVIGWQWLRMAHKALGLPKQDGFVDGKLAACAHWFTTELTRVPELATRVSADPVYRTVSPYAL